MNSDGPYSFQDLSGAQPESRNSAKQVIRELAEYSRRVRQFITREIKSESRSIAAGQLNLTSTKLDTFAEALRDSAGKLRKKHSYSLANIMELGSESMMRISNNLRETTPESIIVEMEEFGRKQPGIFFGLAVVAGILVGQLFTIAGERDGTVQEFNARRESSIEYRPGDEGEHHEPH